MQTDWIYGLIGGGLIGCAAALYLITNGRVMGASGIIGGLIDGTGRATALERVVFILGLIGAPALVTLVQNPPSTHLTGNWVVIILAGLMVGLGTRLANGCTSGHGVCGISRLSLRGILATLIYIGAGGLTMWAARHMLGVI